MCGDQLPQDLWKEAVSMRRIGKLSVIVIYILMGFFCAILIMLSAPRFVGLESYTVVSGSMEPEIPVGSAVYVKKRAFEEISEGDVITFLTEHGKMRVTHRVTAVDEEEKMFATKGDANDHADGQMVKWENVCGVVVCSLPGVGYLQNFLGSWHGKVAAAAVLAGLFLLAEFLENANTKKETS